MFNAMELAAANLQAMSTNPYPGRGIVLGRTPDGTPVQIYWIMGRKEDSRNRVLEEIPRTSGGLRTRIADPNGFSGDPSLLIYTAMAEKAGTFVVSNGSQTEVVLRQGTCVLDGNLWRYEPDSPNYTPRITGVTRFVVRAEFGISLIILRKSPFDKGCECLSYEYEDIIPGYGYCISTYSGDGNPLPSYTGEPQLMPIDSNDPEEIAAAFWAALDHNNRVGLAVKLIDGNQPSEIKIINRHTTG